MIRLRDMPLARGSIALGGLGLGLGLAIVLVIGPWLWFNPTPAAAGFNPNSMWEDIGNRTVTRCDHGNRIYVTTNIGMSSAGIAAVKGCD